MIDMSITYPPDIEATINRLVEEGRFSDSTEALRAAVHLLEERERQHENLLAKLQIGLDEADRGEVDDWTPELRERIRQEAHEMFLRGEEPDPDVLP